MVITKTPFRISFFGGGTDYPVWYEKNGGAVLSASINKYCYVISRYLPPFFDCKYRIRYSKHEETQTIQDIHHPSVRECLTFLNFEQGIETQHNTDVPGMSGLGSSSAFTVGFLNSLYALQEKEITKKQLALDAIHVEQQRIKESVGSQDQTTAAFGGLNKIEFGGDEIIKVIPVSLDTHRLHEFQNHLMLFFSGFSRNASDIAAEQIKNTPKKTAEFRILRAMVDDAYDILVNTHRDIDEIGKLLHEHWRIKRSLTEKISTPTIDHLYEMARNAGAIGGKLLGAGGGGFMLLFVCPEKQSNVQAALRNFLYVPFKFENEGSKVIYQLSQEKYV